MRKVTLILFACFLLQPLAAQKLTKEQKEAAAKAAYQAAVESIELRTFVIVPTSYTESDGAVGDNADNANFLSAEGENLFAQGRMVCGNGYTNLLEATEYEVNIDKKGNIKLRIKVLGRMMTGIYNISIRNNTNVADVIFSPQSGTTLRFSGPIVPLKQASYNKRANPI